MIETIYYLYLTFFVSEQLGVFFPGFNCSHGGDCGSFGIRLHSFHQSCGSGFLLVRIFVDNMPTICNMDRSDLDRYQYLWCLISFFGALNYLKYRIRIVKNIKAGGSDLNLTLKPDPFQCDKNLHFRIRMELTRIQIRPSKKKDTN